MRGHNAGGERAPHDRRLPLDRLAQAPVRGRGLLRGGARPCVVGGRQLQAARTALPTLRLRLCYALRAAYPRLCWPPLLGRVSARVLRPARSARRPCVKRGARIGSLQPAGRAAAVRPARKALRHCAGRPLRLFATTMRCKVPLPCCAGFRVVRRAARGRSAALVALGALGLGGAGSARVRRAAPRTAWLGGGARVGVQLRRQQPEWAARRRGRPLRVRRRGRRRGAAALAAGLLRRQEERGVELLVEERGLLRPPHASELPLPCQSVVRRPAPRASVRAAPALTAGCIR